MASADVTRRALSLGARDSTTNWPSKSYTETTIQGSFDPLIAREVAFANGMPLTGIPYMSSPFYTADYVRRGDHIEHAVLGEYELTDMRPVTWLDQFLYHACNAAKIISPADRAATSGTWHVDSEAIKTDPRNRIKAWLEAYISYAVCDYEFLFSGIDYPIEREFTDMGLEIVSMIDLSDSHPEYTHDHRPYKFRENIKITNFAIDTATLTATNILESFEQAIRDVDTDNQEYNIRAIDSTEPDRVNIGGMWLWQNTITIEYTRANDDYTPTYPRITWGPSASPTGTFTFPNVTGLRWRFEGEDDWMSPVNFSGELVQALGSEALEFELTCDLDFEPAALTWMRPQTTTPKTDKDNFDVFADIKHNEGIDQDYHRLYFSASRYLKVRLVRMDAPSQDGERIVILLFREYRADSASDETWLQRTAQ